MQSLLGNSRKADITFSVTGRICITSHVARLLRLQRGDVLDILADGEEFYLYVRHRAPTNGRHEAAVYPTNRKGNNFRAWSPKLCAAMLAESRQSGYVRLCVGDPIRHPVQGTLLPIITKYVL